MSFSISALRSENLSSVPSHPWFCFFVAGSLFVWFDCVFYCKKIKERRNRCGCYVELSLVLSVKSGSSQYLPKTHIWRWVWNLQCWYKNPWRCWKDSFSQSIVMICVRPCKPLGTCVWCEVSYIFPTSCVFHWVCVWVCGCVCKWTVCMQCLTSKHDTVYPSTSL